MFGIFDEIGKLVGTTIGIATSPIAIALNISESMVKEAVKAGCKTQDEIRQWVRRNK